VAQLIAIPGIGAWTAHYIAMRALGEPDAFPAGDLILRRAATLATELPLTEVQLRQRAEAWRPWRAYAAMLLWSTYNKEPMMHNSVGSILSSAK
jgi:AraC family transcriptional regulator, regulatory protein of adaptative response / DNA-3-methyladenine glycosylase II